MRCGEAPSKRVIPVHFAADINAADYESMINWSVSDG